MHWQGLAPTEATGEFAINDESVSRISPWGQGTSLRGEELLRAQVCYMADGISEY